MVPAKQKLLIISTLKVAKKMILESPITGNCDNSYLQFDIMYQQGKSG